MTAAISDAIAGSRTTGVLNLASRELEELPSGVLDEESHSGTTNWWEVVDLTKLILRDNAIGSLPSQMQRLTALTLLDVSANRLTALPDSLAQLGHLRALDTSANPLGGAGLPDAVAALPALASLTCNACGLPGLPAMLGGAQQPHLAAVAAAGNRLTRLPDGLAAAGALVRLDVSRNQIDALPPATLRGMTRLSELDVSGNALEALPPEVSRLNALKVLSVHRNSLSTLPPELAECTSLVELDAAFNALTRIPPELGRLVALRRLSLAHNQLQEFPEQLCGLELRLLDLGNNSLHTLPPRLGLMASLRSIVLDGNPLKLMRRQLWSGPVSALLEHLRSRLPDAASEPNESALPSAAPSGLSNQMASLLLGPGQELVLRGRGLSAPPPELREAGALLHKLDLSDNPLGPTAHELPALLSSCPALRHLALNSAGLTQWPLPAQRGALSALTVLQLRANRIAVLPTAGAFAAVPALRECDLSGTPAARALPTDLNEDAPRVESMLLAGCGLTRFPEPLLALGASLRVVVLEGNALEAVPEALVQLSRLETLDLRNNSLRSLPPQLGRMRGHLRWLMLEGNVLRTIRRPILERGTPALLEYLESRIPAGA